MSARLERLQSATKTHSKAETEATHSKSREADQGREAHPQFIFFMFSSARASRISTDCAIVTKPWAGTKQAQHERVSAHQATYQGCGPSTRKPTSKHSNEQRTRHLSASDSQVAILGNASGLAGRRRKHAKKDNDRQQQRTPETEAANILKSKPAK